MMHPNIIRKMIIATAMSTFALAGSAMASHPPDHVVVVIEENTNYDDVVGASPNLQYIRSLVQGGALFRHSEDIFHPSQPNYFALFSGSTAGIVGDTRPKQLFDRDNLFTALSHKNRTFRAYSGGFTKHLWEVYVPRHNPWVYFTNFCRDCQVDATLFPQLEWCFRSLPTVSFVVPDNFHDMHTGFPEGERQRVADRWLRNNIDHYVRWAKQNNSLLILTWDEAEPRRGGPPQDRIATVFVGQMVKPCISDQPITHYSVLATIEDFYGLQHVGSEDARKKPRISGVWKWDPYSISLGSN